jgi:RsiW-degrading membrane proteinase PrsW (M82 family)
MLPENTLLWTRALGFVAGAAVFWIQYFDLKDYLHPEPRRMLVFAYFLGALSAGAALGVYWLVEKLGGPDDPGFTTRSIFFYCFLVVGPIEEGIQYLFARVFIFSSVYFDEPIDGLIYSSAIAIGFASVESLIYVPLLTWPYQLAHDLVAPLTHSLFSSLWGFGTAYALFQVARLRNRILLQFFCVVGAALLHGTYDFLLLSKNATFLASGVALVLWAFLIVYARRLVRARNITANT